MAALIDAIEGLKNTLDGAVGLVGVNVLTGTPESAEDVVSPDGSSEVIAIGMGPTTVDRQITTLRAGVVDVDETWSIPVVVQVLAEEGDHLTAVRRATEIHSAAMSEVQNTPMLGVTGYTRFECVWTGSATVNWGPLPNGAGHGCRIEDSVTLYTFVRA